MLRDSIPEFSVSHNNSLSVNINNKESIQNNVIGSDRKNPLAYLLGSVNASVDTQQNDNMCK